MALTDEQVQHAYLAYFGRPADPEGLAYWKTQTLDAMYSGFASSQEYADLYSGMTSEQRVEQVYQNLLGRASDAAGKAYWVGQLSSGARSVSDLVVAMLEGASGVDALTIQNRTTYAEIFTAQIDTHAEVLAYNGSTAAANARTAVSAVTYSNSSLTNAIASVGTTITNIGNIGNGGSSDTTSFIVTNTSGILTFSGTATGDITLGLSGTTGLFQRSGVTATTRVDNVQTAATIQGGASADSLVMASQITSLTFDGQGGSDKLTLANTGNTATLTLTSVESLVGGTGADVIELHNALTGGAAFNFDGKTGSDSLTLAGGGNTVSLTLTDVESLTGGTGADAIALGSAVTGLVVDGNGGADRLTLHNGTNSATLTNVASVTGGTGADTITMGAAITELTFFGGGGSDKLILAGGGNTVSLTLTDVESLTGGTGADLIRLYSDVTGLVVDGNGGADRLTLHDGTNSATLTNVASVVGGTGADTITMGATVAALTFDGGSGGNDKLILANVANTAALTLTSVESVEGGSAVDNLTVTSATGVNIAGLADDDAITGGAGDDTITGGADADLLNGNGGSDVYNYTATTDGSTTPGLGDTIATANFVSGMDKLQFESVAFGSMGAGDLAVDSNTVVFNTDQATTLGGFTTAAGTDADVYSINLTGSTLNSDLYDAIDAAAALGAAATGAAFYVVDNGTNTVILYDAAAETASAGSLVELVTITGLTDCITGLANGDLVIANAP